MKTFTIIVAFLVSINFFTNVYGQISKNLDNINVDMILKNERILKNYLKCLLDKGPCTQEARELKTTLPELLRSNCSECTEKQRRTSRKVIVHMKTKYPQDWNMFQKKYDPSGSFTEAIISS